MEYFDEDFLKIQAFISKLNEDIVISNLETIPESELISQLIYQIKLYGTKIIELYETLDQQYPIESKDDESPFKTGRSTENRKALNNEAFSKTSKHENENFSQNIKSKNFVQQEPIFSNFKKVENQQNIVKNLNEENFKDHFENLNTIENYELDNVEEVLKSLDKCFSNPEKYLEGCNILQNIDYCIVPGLEMMKYIEYLIISHKVKDEKIEKIAQRCELKSNTNLHFSNYLSTIDEFFERNRNLNNYILQLEGKIEYLNEKIEEMNEELNSKEDRENHKPNAGDEKNSQLNKELLILKEEKEKFEKDITELLEEFADLKSKYEEALDITEQQKTIIEKINKENVQLKEEREFAEDLEDVDKLKEGLIEKDQKITFYLNELEKVNYEKENSQKVLKEHEITYLEKISKILQNVELLAENFKEIFSTLFNEHEIKESMAKQLQDLYVKLSQILYLYPDYKRVFPPSKQEIKISEFDEIPKNLMEDYLKTNVNRLRSDLENQILKCQNLERFNQSMQSRIESLEFELDQKNKCAKTFNDLIGEWQERYKKIAEEISNKEEILLKNEEDQNFYQQKIQEMQGQLEAHERLIGEREAIILNYCKSITDWRDKYSIKEKEYIGLQTEYSETKSELMKAKESTFQLESKVLDITTKFEEFRSIIQTKLSQANKENSEFKNRVFGLESLISSQEKTIKLKEDQINTLSQKSKYLENEINKWKEMRDKNRKLIDAVSNTGLEIDELKKELVKKDGIIAELQLEAAVNLRGDRAIEEENEKLKRELNALRIEYQKIIESNEKLIIDNDNLGCSLLKESMLAPENDLEFYKKKINYPNKMDISKRPLEKSSILKDKNLFLNQIISERDRESIRPMEHFKPIETQKIEPESFLQRSKNKTVDEKDQEIKRLSKIVQNLSNKCLKDSLGPKK